MSALLREMISQQTTEVGTRAARVKAAGEALKAAAAALAAPDAARNALLADVRGPLHTLQPLMDVTIPLYKFYNL